MFGITVTVDIYYGKKRFNRYYQTINMPFIPYPKTVLDLAGFSQTVEVEYLMWCETNVEEKIRAFGKIVYNKHAVDSGQWLHKNLIKYGWKVQ